MRKSTIAAIRTHAIAEYPRECCGLLVSSRDGSEAYVPCRNLAADGGQFLLPAEDYAAAEDQGNIVAVVHSHPDAPAQPSEADLVACEASGLPWYIVEVRKGDDGVIATHHVYSWSPDGYQAPLVGRAFHHGILDCYTIIRDWWLRERGVVLMDFHREDGWWNTEQELYLDNYEAAGWRRLADDEPLEPGDMIVMQVQSQRANHAGVYLGDQPLTERPDLHPLSGAMLHHLYGRPSERVVYGGYWRDVTRARLRYAGEVEQL